MRELKTQEVLQVSGGDAQTVAGIAVGTYVTGAWAVSCWYFAIPAVVATPVGIALGLGLTVAWYAASPSTSADNSEQRFKEREFYNKYHDHPYLPPEGYWNNP